jgi:hypothetical protein
MGGDYGEGEKTGSEDLFKEFLGRDTGREPKYGYLPHERSWEKKLTWYPEG